MDVVELVAVSKLATYVLIGVVSFFGLLIVGMLGWFLVKMYDLCALHTNQIGTLEAKKVAWPDCDKRMTKLENDLKERIILKG